MNRGNATSPWSQSEAGGREAKPGGQDAVDKDAVGRNAVAWRTRWRMVKARWASRTSRSRPRRSRRTSTATRSVLPEFKSPSLSTYRKAAKASSKRCKAEVDKQMAAILTDEQKHKDEPSTTRPRVKATAARWWQNRETVDPNALSNRN